MKTKHTKGLWKTRKGFSSDTIEVFAPNPKIEKPFRPTALAVVEADTPEGKANAQLICAAPLMLEAINYVLDHPVTFVDNAVAAMLENARDVALGQNVD
jgi:hypothetical protein